MNDIGKLREALEDADYRLEQGTSISPPYVDRTLFDLAAAARDFLALLESDAIVIRRDSEGNWPEDLMGAVGDGWWVAHIASNKRVAAQIILDTIALALADSSKGVDG